ncbi:hypothetical protein JCM10207_001612 [Rhodosporidiobolus poonsookiae]
MLESVRSRQLYGFGVLALVPACVVGGYYLRTKEDARIAHEAAAAAAGERVQGTLIDEKAVRERIEKLRRREKELDAEADELRTKLERAKGRNDHAV